jgi:uncharacterized membrane protein
VKAGLQYFGAGFTALGVMAVVLSITSPEQGGIDTIVMGIVAFFVGIAAYVYGGREDAAD